MSKVCRYNETETPSANIQKRPICNKNPISHKHVHICEDGSLLKSIIAMGQKEETPNDNDIVLVNFLAFFPDHTFIQKAHRVKFQVKDGLFCPALQLAVKTMKMEEKALLYVTPKHGFGEKGKHVDDDGDLLVSVPPNASFTICLTLCSWEKPLPFYKEVVKEGEGDDCPEEGARVKLRLIGKLHNGTEFLNRGYGDDQTDLLEFKIDEEQVIDGLDKAVMTMKKGEVALFTIPPQYAFGSSESPQPLAVVPPNSTLYYEVELVSFKNVH